MRRFSILPKSLYGRLLLVLIGGMLLAPMISFGLHLMERDTFMFRIGASQYAQRIADLNNIFDTLTAEERSRIARDLFNRNLEVDFSDSALADSSTDDNALLFSQILNKKLVTARPLKVKVSEKEFLRIQPKQAATTNDEEFNVIPKENVRGFDFKISVALKDGSWATYSFQLPHKHFNLPRGLLLNLFILIVILAVLAWFAVRWITRPLLILANAAESLGKNINVSPLEESGPTEVRHAAHAFNTMQDRISRYVKSRTRILAAMSHDLKTPITRLRLRAELLDDVELRTKFTRDLEELEAMVIATLGFMRGLDNDEVASLVDVNGLLEDLRADYAELDMSVDITGSAQPYLGKVLGLKRCLANLVDNAVKYGGRAQVEIHDARHALEIIIRDEGPGIPEEQLEKVFEPFYRVEASRNRNNGGTGLGLSIARDIAQGHNAHLQLKNRKEGGLEVILTLPRES